MNSESYLVDDNSGDDPDFLPDRDGKTPNDQEEERSYPPKVGTFLGKTKLFSWNGKETVVSGHQWIECWWDDRYNKFAVWCGNPRASSTQVVDLIDWRPLSILNTIPE